MAPHKGGKTKASYRGKGPDLQPPSTDDDAATVAPIHTGSAGPSGTATVATSAAETVERKRDTSIIWDYFSWVTVNGEKKKRCVECLKTKKITDLTGKASGTTHQWEHLEAVHPALYFELFPHKKNKTAQQSIAPHARGENMAFNKKVFWGLLAAAVVEQDVPFSLMESKKWRKAFKYGQRKAVLPSRRSLLRHIRQEYHCMAPKIKELLGATTGKVSFTTDEWTSPNKISFKAVTAHFITAAWRRVGILIGFEPVEGGHSAGDLYDIFAGVIESAEWGLSWRGCSE